MQFIGFDLEELERLYNFFSIRTIGQLLFQRIRGSVVWSVGYFTRVWSVRLAFHPHLWSVFHLWLVSWLSTHVPGLPFQRENKYQIYLSIYFFPIRPTDKNSLGRQAQERFYASLSSAITIPLTAFSPFTIPLARGRWYLTIYNEDKTALSRTTLSLVRRQE